MTEILCRTHQNWMNTPPPFAGSFVHAPRLLCYTTALLRSSQLGLVYTRRGSHTISTSPGPFPSTTTFGATRNQHPKCEQEIINVGSETSYGSARPHPTHALLLNTTSTVSQRRFDDDRAAELRGLNEQLQAKLLQVGTAHRMAACSTLAREAAEDRCVFFRCQLFRFAAQARKKCRLFP